MRACLYFISYSQHSGNEQIVNFEGCSPFFYVLVFIVPAPFSAPDGRSSYQTILGDCLERDAFECLHVQCTVCILNASSPCAPRVKKIRPIVGLLVVSVDTLRLEEASINIDPPHFERCVYFNIWERV